MGNKEPAITVSSWLDVKDWYQLSMKVVDSRKEPSPRRVKSGPVLEINEIARI